ncbi:MAG: hypothetical protein HKN03_02210 [Acidimicrobiales bacterium]|nr:hypothetical protein [Acidimicrobiales bacterium]
MPLESPRLAQDLPDVSVARTTELRWFFDGPLQADVRSWFMPGGEGLLEHRCDTYLLDGFLHIGVKQRARRTLELKIRTGLPAPASIAPDVYGGVETWRRWSPADRLLTLDHDSVWLDVDKTIVKRRFGTDGQEKLLSESTRAMTGQGCDAEIAALWANGREAWTLAFAAFGQPDTHCNSLRSAWRSLSMGLAPPGRLDLGIDRSYGYPEWISKAMESATASQTSASP